MDVVRSIQAILKAEKVNMGGVLLDQALPLAQIEQVDPFLLIHHWHQNFPGGQKQKDLGVGPHPHRGFSPVTLIFKGNVHHRDSLGYESIVEAGGTQWMNTGKGVIHSERPGKDLAEVGGEFEIIQFWVNAPSTHKMDPPQYQPLKVDEMPRFKSFDNKVEVGLVAGQMNGFKSPLKSYSPLLVLRMNFDQSGIIKLPVKESFNALIYVLDGSLNVNVNHQANEKDLVLFQNDGSEIHLEATKPTRAILLAGAPIKEPMSNYGPFVMNTQAELMEAIKDFQAGKMGHLEEVF